MRDKRGGSRTNGLDRKRLIFRLRSRYAARELPGRGAAGEVATVAALPCRRQELRRRTRRPASAARDRPLQAKHLPPPGSFGSAWTVPLAAGPGAEAIVGAARRQHAVIYPVSLAAGLRDGVLTSRCRPGGRVSGRDLGRTAGELDVSQATDHRQNRYSAFCSAGSGTH